MKHETKTTRLAMVLLGGALLLVGLALAGNTTPTCVPIEPEPIACTGDADCEGLQPTLDCVGRFFCEDGGCVYRCDEEPPEPCWTDADCGPGEVCEMDRSVDCCAPNELCFDILPACVGTCVPASDPFDCDTDQDCGPYEQCVQDWVDCGPPPGCEPGDDCIAMCGPPVLVGSHCAPAPQLGCYNDPTLCSRGENCVPEDDFCCAPDSDEICLFYRPACNGVCVPNEPPPPEGCYTDADCGPNEQCHFAPGDGCCPIDANCGDFQPICIGQCVALPPPPETCHSDADCGPHARCEVYEDVDCCMGDDEWCLFYLPLCEGVCVPELPPPPPEECFSDADCPAGTHCEWQLENCCPPNAFCDASIPSCTAVCLPDDPTDCGRNGDNCAP